MLWEIPFHSANGSVTLHFWKDADKRSSNERVGEWMGQKSLSSRWRLQPLFTYLRTPHNQWGKTILKSNGNKNNETFDWWNMEYHTIIKNDIDSWKTRSKLDWKIFVSVRTMEETFKICVLDYIKHIIFYVRKCNKIKGKLVKWFVINIIGTWFTTLCGVGGMYFVSWST